MSNFAKTETTSPTDIALEFRERIRQAPDFETKLLIREEWNSVYQNFTPERKAELEPYFAEIHQSIERSFTEMDALIADFKEKHPGLTHLFEEK